MAKKLASFALPLCLVLMSVSARPSHAATPIATFGVSATVLAGCSVSTTTLHGTFDAALEKAASAVTVNCSNTTHYSIVVTAEAAPGAAVPIGNLTFPLRSLMNYAMPNPAHNLKWSGIASTGEPAGTSAVASNAHPDTISVAITY